MPNVKLYVDQTKVADLHAGLADLLPRLRSMLCETLDVDVQACQFAVIPVFGLPDQPLINAELSFLTKPDRTACAMHTLARHLRQMIGDCTGASVAVRIATLEPAGYFTLK